MLAAGALALGVAGLSERAARASLPGVAGAGRQGPIHRVVSAHRARSAVRPTGGPRAERGIAVSRPTGMPSALIDLSDVRAAGDAAHAGDRAGGKPAGQLSVRELEGRAAQVAYEAGRRLEMLAEKYDLTEDQQALVFPVIARASPAYVPALPIKDSSLSDAYLLARRSSAPVAASAADLPWTTLSDDSASGARLGVVGQAMASGAPRAPAGVDDAAFEVALNASQDALEARIAPFLNSAQLAQLTEEELDRYYWWGEILLQLSGEADPIAAATASATVSTGQPGTGDPAAEGDEEAAVPVAHQGGNLLDLLEGQP